jgi:enolase
MDPRLREDDSKVVSAPMRIEQIIAREILDSRGFPTIEVDLSFANGAWGRAAVPSGASTGQFEALELRDGDPKRFCGKGVLNACKNVHEKIAPTLCGKLFETQAQLDTHLCQLDGTPNKSHLGANAILAVSLAYARARSVYEEKRLFESLQQSHHAMSLPTPMINVINGGAHADNPLSIQEFMIIPYGFTTFHEAIACGSEIFMALKGLLKKQGFATNVGDEGGFAPALKSSRAALDVLSESVVKAGYSLGKQVGFALDVAASELLGEDGKYHFPEEKLILDQEALVLMYDTLLNEYPIISIEDGCGEIDFEGWKLMTQAFGDKVQLVGDDLFVTNTTRLKAGIEQRMANSILVKVNQIGTLTESLQAIEMAQQAGFGVVISHRSGETEDTFIADLAVATGAGQIKTGSVSRSDRVAKYNQLLRIEGSTKLPYSGGKSFSTQVIERVCG